MSTKTVPVNVTILEKEYCIACPPDDKNMLESSAQYLNMKMNEIRGKGKAIGNERLAIMAALNITHDLLKAQSKNEVISETVGDRIHTIQQKITSALAKGKQIEL